MTQEEKVILLQEFCARLPYGVKVNHKGLIRPLFSVSPTQCYQIILDNAIDGGHNGLELVSLDEIDAVELKPYLRPMSSMTEEEKKVFRRLASLQHNYLWDGVFYTHWVMIDWLIINYFDYRGLIPMGLALKAPKGMYN